MLCCRQECPCCVPPCLTSSLLHGFQVLNAVPELVAWAHAPDAAPSLGGSWKPKAVVAPAFADLLVSMWRAGFTVGQQECPCPVCMARSWGLVSKHGRGARGSWPIRYEPACHGHLIQDSCGTHPNFLVLTCSQSVVSPSAFLKRIARHDSRWGDGSQQDSQVLVGKLAWAPCMTACILSESPLWHAFVEPALVNQALGSRSAM